MHKFRRQELQSVNFVPVVRKEDKLHAYRIELTKRRGEIFMISIKTLILARYILKDTINTTKLIAMPVHCMQNGTTDME